METYHCFVDVTHDDDEDDDDDEVKLLLTYF